MIQPYKEMITMIEAWSAWEAGLLFWMQQHIRSDMATVFWEEITDLGNAGMIWIILAVGLIVYKKTRVVGITAALAILLNVVVTNGILKLWVARPRPFTTFDALIPLIAPPPDFSFPSGHSACSFAVAFVMYRLLPKKYSIPALVLAALIGLSRLYLGVHYPTDVLAGASIGCLAAEMAIWMRGKIMRSA